MKPMYSGSYSFITETLTRFNVSVDFCDVDKERDFTLAVRKALRRNTKMIFVEVMANPSMAMPNLIEIIELAKENQVLCFVDATFASPICVQPIALGADFCMHSCSKYIGGHTDVIGGCVTTKSMEHWKRLKLQQFTTGSAESPFDASLLARGLKTLSLRMDKIASNALLVAEFLDSHSKVLHTYYPGLPSHPMHDVSKRYMKKWSGMVAFDVGTAKAAATVVESVRLIVHAVSLGGTESLIEHPLSMSHSAELLREEAAEPMIQPGLLRLSVGIENARDLIADLERALSFV